MIRTIVALLAIWPATALAADAPRSFETRVIMSGHSLTDPIPVPLAAMVRSMGHADPVIRASTIPGSPMDWRWKNAPGHGAPDARADIGRFDVLVLTERTPLSRTIKWHDSPDMALKWARHAWENGSDGKGAATVLYATWPEIDTGPGTPNPYDDPDGDLTLLERLPKELADWERIVDHVNANRPSAMPQMRLIPGPLLIGGAAKAIAAGEAPGLEAVSDLFSDAIHLNERGAYLVALAHYAVVYGRDPRELPEEGADVEMKAWMQDFVWATLKGYERAGL